MQIHLQEVVETEGRQIRVSAPLEMREISFQQGTFPILASDPVELEITNIGNRELEMKGSGSVTVEIPCDRCLEPVRVLIPFRILRKLDMKQTEQDRVDDLDECGYLTGSDLDADRLACLELLLNWPVKVLCREDCKGLCPRCGKDLNDGPCGCDEEAKDPRMAAISDIFRKFKEV